MRSPGELLELPYSFEQQRLLMPSQFLSAVRERGFSFSEEHLEALHRARLLVPFLRVRRDGRLIAALSRGNHVRARQFAGWHPTTRRDLNEAADARRLFDPASEHFISRERRRRRTGDLTYLSSEYLYSAHQVIMLPAIKAGVPFLSRARSGVDRALDPYWLRSARAQTAWLREVVIAVSALEPVYHPSVTGTVRISDYEGYVRWMKTLRPLEMLKWLRVEPVWLSEMAARLLRSADGIDPLGDWFKVIREADPDRLSLLKRDARSAIDLRIAAEVLLRYYERLVRARRARALLPPAKRQRGPFDSRLKRQGGLDTLLTRFGLSPHPSLVLVVEGETELLLIPRLMEKFGIRTDRDYIAIENMAGVGRDLSSLVSYLAPRAEADEEGQYLKPSTPLTRVLVVADAEGPLTTAEKRERRRGAWVDRIITTLPKEHRTEVVRDALNEFVFMDTWNLAGESFEFAHFTDRQLAQAIDALDSRSDKPGLPELARRLASVRSSKGSIEPLLPRTSTKLDLADALWPVLEAKVDRALTRGTETRIPIVRVLDRATDIAHEYPRRGVVIPLRPAA
jgi:hypothetical protein